MRRLLVPVLAVLVVLGGTVSSLVPPAAAQPAEQDVLEAAAVAVELSRFEASGSFNALYDRIHPDAHAVIPRAAVLGWYEHEFAPRGPGVSTVTGVAFVSWTWPVTGVTYPATAEVAFEQPFADGSVVEDVVRLVRDDGGDWRWFFGRSREFVEERIARYVSAAPPPVGPTAGTLVGLVSADLDAFWRDAFAAEPDRYVSPSVVPFDQATLTACGPADPAYTGPFYCLLDQTIYLQEDFIAGAEAAIGDFAAAFIVAHEWGHHVQHLRGLRRSEAPDEFGEFYSIELELMADCYAGVWTRDADTRGLLVPGDVEEAVLLALNIGDAPGTRPDDPSAHGSNPMRVKSFLDGYYDGILACDAYLDGGPTTAANGGDARATEEAPAPADEGEAADLLELLPSEDDAPAGLIVAQDQQRTLAEVVANYSDPVEAGRRFTDWGWEANVTRAFAPDEDDALPPDATVSVYVSIHRFGDAAGAREALPYSFEDQLPASAVEVAIAPVGEEARAFYASTADGNELTVYVQQDNLLVRVTAISPAGDPSDDAVALMGQIVANIG
jgi:hypothetical protein